MARVDGVIGDSAAKVYFYHTDNVGSTKAITNYDIGSDGVNRSKVVWNADYQAFGTQFGKNKVDPNFEEDEFAFTGKGYDGDTGLYYYDARWYDSETGRFISEDPVADPNNPNLYSYGANNPLSNTDPTGLDVHNDQGEDPQDVQNGGGPTMLGDTGVHKSTSSFNNTKITVKDNKDGTVKSIKYVDDHSWKIDYLMIIVH